jgi:hypothetical protein
MSQLHRYAPQILLIVGIIIALVSYFADYLGTGSMLGFGRAQWLGCMIGLLLSASGITVWALRDRD